MKAPAFWEEHGLLPRLLTPFSWLWSRMALYRMARTAPRVTTVPVIVVGNLTTGGAGKTPTVIALLHHLQAMGLKPAVVSRGYGGRGGPARRVDPARDRAADVGDEPLLLAEVAPTWVDPTRVAGARLAEQDGADVIVLDDGFQSARIAADLAVVVLDRGQGIGNGRVVPGGPMRAPLRAQLDRAHVLVTIDCGEPIVRSAKAVIASADHRLMPIFRGRLEPRRPEALAGRRVVAYAGIGRPEKFVATLTRAGAEVVELVSFADHAALTPQEAEQLLARAEAIGATLVTTAKDAVRLRGLDDGPLGRLRALSEVLEVDLVLEEAESLTGIVDGLRRAAHEREHERERPRPFVRVHRDGRRAKS